jgi:hypothetical protein
MHGLAIDVLEERQELLLKRVKAAETPEKADAWRGQIGMLRESIAVLEAHRKVNERKAAWRRR